MNKNALNETRPITSSWYNVFSYWTFSKSGIFGFFLPTVYFLWLSCFVVIPLLLNKRWAIVALTIGLKVKTTTTWSKWHFWIILYIFINMIHFTMSKLKKILEGESHSDWWTTRTFFLFLLKICLNQASF